MTKHFASLALLTACLACSTAQPPPASEPATLTPVVDVAPEVRDALYSVHLYRHAEKQSGPDPALTAFGETRAQHIAHRLTHPDMAIRRIWSSDYRRTRDTAKPLADALGIETSLYDPRDQDALVARLHEEEVDSVVIGHSNTIPQLAALLCECEVEPMPESEYERAYVVVVGTGISYLYQLDMRQTWDDRP